MIEVSDKIQKGDLVYVWFSPFKEKNKKPLEVEYRVGDITPTRLQLNSPSGGYHILFGKELLETWWGNVRKAK